MRGLSYSLKELSVGVALAAIAAAAVVYPSEPWAVLLTTSAVVLVAFAGVAVAMYRPWRAPFLAGFFSLGVILLLLFYGPDWLRGHVPQNLLPQYASMYWARDLEESYKPLVPGAKVTRSYQNGQWVNGQFLSATPGAAEWQVWQNGKARLITTPAPPNFAHLVDIANSLFVLIVAAAGGMVARFCGGSRRQGE
jgi:hypothetical protein